MTGVQIPTPRSRVLRATVVRDGQRSTFLHAWVSICRETRQVRIYRDGRDIHPAATAQIHQVDIDWRARGLYL